MISQPTFQWIARKCTVQKNAKQNWEKKKIQHQTMRIPHNFYNMWTTIGKCNCDSKAALIPISKNCRNILIIPVTGSTEPTCPKDAYRQYMSQYKSWKEVIPFGKYYNNKRYDQHNESLRNAIYLFENNTMQWLQRTI